MIDKKHYLKMATDVAKEYARGGSGNGGYDGPANVLESMYEKLLELAKTIEE